MDSIQFEEKLDEMIEYTRVMYNNAHLEGNDKKMDKYAKMNDFLKQVKYVL